MKSEDDFSLAPLVLIFFSQFVLGIGTTLYYTLGSPYLDDGTAKKNTPMMLAYAMSFRIIGLIFGFGLVAGTMRVYIDPWSTPLIDYKDPRWLGAWWLGWYILGAAMVLSSLFIGLFPKVLPKKMTKLQMKMMEEADSRGNYFEEEKPLRPLPAISEVNEDGSEVVKDTFAIALRRLLKNKLLMYNTLGSVFYLLGSSVFMTYFSKYLEVQFNKTSADSSLLTGPATILSMVTGILFSGYFISKYQPPPSKLFFFNVIVGLAYVMGQFSNLFLACESSTFFNESGLVNLTTTCNVDCLCDGVPYSPVCDVMSGTTYFSPCHGGCKSWSDSDRMYTDCACSGSVDLTNSIRFSSKLSNEKSVQGEIYSSTESTWRQDEDDIEDSDDGDYYPDDYDSSGVTTQTSNAPRSARQTDQTSFYQKYSMIPGACMAGCGYTFLIYTLISCAINWLGSAARIGNLLVNFRYE